MGEMNDSNLFYPKTKLSLQIYRQRSEPWVVISGTARVTRGEEVFDVPPLENTFIHLRRRPWALPMDECVEGS